MAPAVAIIGIVLAVASGVVAGVGQHRQAKAAKQAADFNAKLAMRKSYAEERAIRRRAALVSSRAETMVAKSGVDMLGSPLELMAQNAREFEIDAVNARYYGQAEASYLRASGKNALSAGKWALGTSIVGGLASGASMAYTAYGGTKSSGATGELGSS